MRIAAALITGFAQPARISNGLAELRAKLLPLDIAYLEVHPWGVDALALAEQLAAVKADRNILVGHSYGVWKCTKVAALLPNVDDLFSADGVSREGRPRMLTIPRTVRRLSSWRQTENKVIKGSPFRLDLFDTDWVVNQYVVARHSQVDEELEFHAAVLSACQAN